MRNLGAFARVLALAIAASIFGIGSVLAQQSFSCPFGTQASCLDYGDKVCSSYSKCVSQDSVCFDSYTCGYEGFICKSKYDDLVDEYDDLLRKNRRLVSEYNSLLAEYQENIDDYNRLLGEHSALASCISFADTLDEAQSCAW